MQPPRGRPFADEFGRAVQAWVMAREHGLTTEQAEARALAVFPAGDIGAIAQAGAAGEQAAELLRAEGDVDPTAFAFLAGAAGDAGAGHVTVTARVFYLGPDGRESVRTVQGTWALGYDPNALRFELEAAAHEDAEGSYGEQLGGITEVRPVSVVLHR